MGRCFRKDKAETHFLQHKQKHNVGRSMPGGTGSLLSPHNAHSSTEMWEASDSEIDYDCRTNTITTNAESVNNIAA